MARIAGMSSERVHGWFRLLTESLGRRKHFAVSFLNASHETTRTKMEEMVLLDDNTTPATGGVAVDDNKQMAVGARPSTQPPRGQTPYTITINVVRGSQAFGFSVAWTKPPRVERVEEGLPAHQAGLKPGDYIIFIGQYNVVKYEEEAVLKIIRECGDTLPLEVYRRGVSKHPRGLVNGYTSLPAPTDNEAHTRKRLSHITFNTEKVTADRQHTIYSLINCEQAFSNSCRFGLERYLIPLKFRSDLVTQTQHDVLFNNLDQLMDLSETLVDRLMGNDDDNIGDQVGRAYYMLIEELSEHYRRYLGGLPEADKVLSQKLHDLDFKDFLQVPLVPCKKPDITTFIHKPAEHLREVLGLLTQVYAVSPGHLDNTYLDAVLDRLKECYRAVTTQQNIMEPVPRAHPPTDLAGSTPTPAHARPHAPLRPPLVSVADIEQRLVFTKYTQPFRLNDGRRQWVFGGELYKFEGRHLKQHWAMLFTDLVLFTKINRDRVIFVMEDPVPLGGVCQALFTIKKKPTELRLIVDTRVVVTGAGSGYLTTPKCQLPTNKNTVYRRGHRKTVVLRAPTVELKATWDLLIQRQLFVCQQQQQQQQLGSPLGPVRLHHQHAASLSRAVSTDGLHAFTPATSSFSRSEGDLSRGDGDSNEEEVLLDLGNDPLKGSSSSLFKSSKIRLRSSGEVEEELILNLDNEASHASSSVSMPPATPSAAPASRVTHRPSGAPEGQLQFVIEDEGHRGSSHRAVRSSKVRSWGGQKKEEELVLNLNDGESRTTTHYDRSSRVNSALLNHSQKPIPAIIIDRNVKQAVIDNRSILYDEEVFNDVILEDLRTGAQSHFDSKKAKGLSGKVKDKLFPNRHLPKKKKMNRVQKVEKFVDSIMVEDLENEGRVTPLFIGEADLTHGEFERKRQDILQSRTKNYMEGEVEVLSLDASPPSTSRLSPAQAELLVSDERRKHEQKRREEKRTAMRLEGIEEEPQDRSVSHTQEPPPKTVLSPEEYEDYIGDAVEKDYPELAGGVDAGSSEVFQQQDQTVAQQQPLLEQEHPQQQPRSSEVQHQPTGPLSGSASMNFMDEHSPTSNDMDGSRCLKRYGSSCDIAKFGLTDEAIYSHEDDLNANFEVSGRKSKVGGTGSGPFVAKKLAVFEKVAEEEHQKFIEYQEVRKRIFRAPKKSGEYIEKFFSPKVIETIDARACAGSRHEYYDDEYDNYNDDRSPTPPEIITPYGGHSSPQLPSKYSSSSHVYPSTNSNHPGSVSPSQEYTHESYNDEDFDVYDYVCDRQHSPIPASDETVVRYDSPEPHSTNDVDDSYWQSTEHKNISQPQTTSPGASSPPPGSPKDNLDQRTDEVLEMLDHSYSDMAPEQAGPSHDTPSSWRDEVDAGGAVAGYSGYETPEVPNNRSMSFLDDTDPLDDMCEVEQYDRQGPAPSQVGGQKRKAAPPPPTPPSGAPVTPVSDTKRGGFFGRARREKEKEKKEREREKKDKDKKDKKEKKKDKDVTTGKRFQLFGGTKKTSEPSSSEAALAISPKRDKGRRVFFGRGRENFVGRNPCISHGSDPQVARMTGESFEQESIDLEGETEVL